MFLRVVDVTGKTTFAVMLIHEALHTAGLPEDPPTTKAKTSEEINQMVRDACFADEAQ